jgi:hypothetical protein
MCFFDVNVLWHVISSVFASEVGEMLPKMHNITIKDNMVIIEYSVVLKLLIYLAETQNSHLWTDITDCVF